MGCHFLSANAENALAGQLTSPADVAVRIDGAIRLMCLGRKVQLSREYHMKRFCLALSAALLSTIPAWAASPSWTVSERSGPVTILQGGVSRIAIQDSELRSGDVVTTGQSGRAILVRGEEFMVIAPNSRLRIADPAASGGLVQVFEEAGNVIYRIKRMTMKHFAVKTPYLAAVVKGTTFSVSVGPDGASVQVIEGAVEVTTPDGGARDLIKPGMVAAISAGDLGKLRVDGETTRVFVSPTAATEPSRPDGAVDGVSGEVFVTASSDRIEASVSEPAMQLASVTGGMVEGNAAMSSLTSTAETQRMASHSASAYSHVDNVPGLSAATDETPKPVEAVAVITATAQPVEATVSVVETVQAQPPVDVASVQPVQTPAATVETAQAQPPVEIATVQPVEATVAVETAQAQPPVAIETSPPVPVETAVALAEPAIVPAPSAIVETPVERVASAPAITPEVQPVAPVQLASVPAVPASPIVSATPAPIEIAVDNRLDTSGNSANGNAFGNAPGNAQRQGNGNAFGAGNGNGPGNGLGNGNGNGNAFGAGNGNAFGKLKEFLRGQVGRN